MNGEWIREDEFEEKIKLILDKLQIKNKRVLEWVRNALKDGQKSKVEYHKS